MYALKFGRTRTCEGETPCRRSGESKGRAVLKEAFDLPSGGILMQWSGSERVCGGELCRCCGSSSLPSRASFSDTFKYDYFSVASELIPG